MGVVCNARRFAEEVGFLTQAQAHYGNSMAGLSKFGMNELKFTNPRVSMFRRSRSSVEVDLCVQEALEEAVGEVIIV